MPEPTANMRIHRRAACLIVLVTAGCGGSSGGDLFSSAMGGGSGGATRLDASSAGGTTTTSAGGATSASGGQETAGAAGSMAGGAAGAFGAGGTLAGGGAPSAGGATASGGMSGAGPGGSFGAGGTSVGGAANSIACESTTCDVASLETCCFGDGVTPHCAGGDLGGKCTCSGLLCTTITVACDGPEDCTGGQLCCAEEGLTDSVFTKLSCQATCTSGITNLRSEVCHPGGAPCTNGSTCATDTLLPTGYSDCG